MTFRSAMSCLMLALMLAISCQQVAECIRHHNHSASNRINVPARTAPIAPPTYMGTLWSKRVAGYNSDAGRYKGNTLKVGKGMFLAPRVSYAAAGEGHDVTGEQDQMHLIGQFPFPEIDVNEGPGWTGMQYSDTTTEKDLGKYPFLLFSEKEAISAAHPIKLGHHEKAAIAKIEKNKNVFPDDCNVHGYGGNGVVRWGVKNSFSVNKQDCSSDGICTGKMSPGAACHMHDLGLPVTCGSDQKVTYVLGSPVNKGNPIDSGCDHSAQAYHTAHLFDQIKDFIKN